MKINLLNHKSLLVILILSLLVSCSFKGLVIPNATYFIADHVGSKYDFYYNQEKEFKNGLDDIFKQNIDDLEILKSKLEQIDIKNFKVEENLEILAPLYYKVAKSVNALLAKTFSEFNQEQIKNLKEVMNDDNETILNRTRREKTDEIAKRFEFFFHHVTPEQKKLIQDNKVIFQDINKTRLNNRLITQKKMLDILNSKSTTSKLENLNTLFNENLSQREPLTNLIPTAKFCSKFFTTLDEDQIAFFKRRQKLILEWIEGFIVHYSK